MSQPLELLGKQSSHHKLSPKSFTVSNFGEGEQSEEGEEGEVWFAK